MQTILNLDHEKRIFFQQSLVVVVDGGGCCWLLLLLLVVVLVDYVKKCTSNEDFKHKTAVTYLNYVSITNSSVASVTSPTLATVMKRVTTNSRTSFRIYTLSFVLKSRLFLRAFSTYLLLKTTGCRMKDN